MCRLETERLATYRAAADRLIAERKAYPCYCTKEELEERRKVFERQKRPYKYEGTCRNRTEPVPGRTAVVRFRMPEADETVTFEDRVIGKISKQSSDLDDFVMLRADGIPLYNFACVVDDLTMRISHVVRGEEHIINTAPQILMYRALGAEPPQFAHCPVILAQNALELPDLPAAGRVTLVNTVPSALAELVRAGGLGPSVRTVNLAGEPLPRPLADRIHATGTVERLWNLYGPSEDTTYSTFAQVAREGSAPPDIGRPLRWARGDAGAVGAPPRRVSRRT